MELDESAFEAPRFTAHLNDIECDEEADAKFECHLEPKNDPSMKLGKLLFLGPMGASVQNRKLCQNRMAVEWNAFGKRKQDRTSM